MPHERYYNDVDYKKYPAASLVGEIRESPDVSQADGGAGGNHEVAKSGSPLTSFRVCLITHKDTSFLPGAEALTTALGIP